MHNCGKQSAENRIIITMIMIIAFNLYKRTISVVACQHQSVRVHMLMACFCLRTLDRFISSKLGPGSQARRGCACKHQCVMRRSRRSQRDEWLSARTVRQVRFSAIFCSPLRFALGWTRHCLSLCAQTQWQNVSEYIMKTTIWF